MAPSDPVPGTSVVTPRASRPGQRARICTVVTRADRRLAARVQFPAVQQVLVLNASYEPLNVCSVRRAHVLVYKGKAELVEALDRPLRSADATLRLAARRSAVTYVRVPRAAQRRISRRALFARDGWECVYCGTSGVRLTLDHVVPRSRGGDSVWENVVTSCAPCNLRKGNRLLEEAAMVLPQAAAAAGAGALHQARRADDPDRLAPVSRAVRRRGAPSPDDVTRARRGGVEQRHRRRGGAR